MYAARIPTLRKTIKDPRTGQLHHRSSRGHYQNLNTDANNSILNLTDKDETLSPSPIITTPTTAEMPAAETQTDEGTQAPRDDELHRKLDTLADRFEKIEKISDDYKISLEFTQGEVKDLQQENVELKEALAELSLEIKRNTHAIQGLTTKQENVDTLTKRRNLVFEGVPEWLD